MCWTRSAEVNVKVTLTWSVCLRLRATPKPEHDKLVGGGHITEKGCKTFPPISSSVSIIAVRNLSISSHVLGMPDQPSQSSDNSLENSFACGGCCPILRMYSPCGCVSKKDNNSFAIS